MFSDLDCIYYIGNGTHFQYRYDYNEFVIKTHKYEIYWRIIDNNFKCYDVKTDDFILNIHLEFDLSKFALINGNYPPLNLSNSYLKIKWSSQDLIYNQLDKLLSNQ